MAGLGRNSDECEYDCRPGRKMSSLHGRAMGGNWPWTGLVLSGAPMGKDAMLRRHYSVRLQRKPPSGEAELWRPCEGLFDLLEAPSTSSHWASKTQTQA